MKKTKLIKLYTHTILLVMLFSCNKLIEVKQPRNIVTADKVFNNAEDVRLAINGIYSQWIISTPGFNFICSITGDEAGYIGSVAQFLECATNSISASNSFTSLLWDYNGIYRANAIIENVAVKPGITQELVNTATGTAKFTRAYNYFLLVNFFGDVPLVLSTDYTKTATLSRENVNAIYSQIVADLKDAIQLLPTSYDSRGKGIINSWAAKALLARVYLYQKDWQNASTVSNEIIQSRIFRIETDLSKVFLVNSAEAIWQLATLNGISGPEDPRLFIPANNTTTPTFPLSTELLNSFEANDYRKARWIAATNTIQNTIYRYPYKYINRSTGGASTEYLIMLRYAEQFLINAEAQAQLNNYTASLSTLDSIRKRAGLPLLSNDGITRSQADILRLVEQERSHEFFCEQGHRWFDLKRTDRANTILGAIKPAWQVTDQLFPVPNAEMLRNSFLTQNPGYD